MEFLCFGDEILQRTKLHEIDKKSYGLKFTLLKSVH